MRPRKRKGFSLIEVVALVSIVIPILLGILDGITLLYGMSLNDAACREVARTVSTSSPKALDRNAPDKSATAALSTLGQNHGFIQLKQSCQIDEKLMLPLPSVPFGGPVNGQVTVTTTANVTLPFFCNATRHAPIQINASHTCAYNWSMPSIAATSLQ